MESNRCKKYDESTWKQNKIILSKSETEKTPFLKKIIFEFKFIELNPTNFQFSFENGKNLV